jgi:hypothetical protein
MGVDDPDFRKELLARDRKHQRERVELSRMLVNPGRGPVHW